MPQLFKETGKKKDIFLDSTNLVSQILKNIIEKPMEDKYRLLKKVLFFQFDLCFQENKIVKEKLSRYKTGIEIIKLIGFQEAKEVNETVYRLNVGVSASYIKSRRLDFEAAVSLFVSNIK